MCNQKRTGVERPQYRVHRSAGRGQRQVGSTKGTVVVLAAALCWCLAAALPGGCGVGAATEPRQLSGPLCAGLNDQGPPSAQSSNTVFLALRGTWAASGSYSYSSPAWGEGRGGGHKEPMRVLRTHSSGTEGWWAWPGPCSLLGRAAGQRRLQTCRNAAERAGRWSGNRWQG